MGDNINDILLEFRSLDPEPPEVRQKCEKCRLFSFSYYSTDDDDDDDDDGCWSCENQ